MHNSELKKVLDNIKKVFIDWIRTTAWAWSPKKKKKKDHGMLLCNRGITKLLKFWGTGATVYKQKACSVKIINAENSDIYAVIENKNGFSLQAGPTFEIFSYS